MQHSISSLAFVLVICLGLLRFCWKGQPLAGKQSHLIKSNRRFGKNAVSISVCLERCIRLLSGVGSTLDRGKLHCKKVCDADEEEFAEIWRRRGWSFSFLKWEPSVRAAPRRRRTLDAVAGKCCLRFLCPDPSSSFGPWLHDHPPADRFYMSYVCLFFLLVSSRFMSLLRLTSPWRRFDRYHQIVLGNIRSKK